MKARHKLECYEVAYASDEYEKCVQLRYHVLREPLGLAFSNEQLAAEANDFHLACFRDGELVGCLSLVEESARVHMRQVAVLPQYQGQGIGRTLVEFAERFARGKGFALMVLHARETALPFYEKLGYKRIGESFEEVTLTHWKMMKEL
jgi:ribosomal protein S18 acetylase RimI-like enzyme